MPSQTISAASGLAPGSVWHRGAPVVQSWPRVACAAALLAIVATGLREWSLRESGHLPSMSMPAGLWAWQRNLVRAAPADSTVLLGSSRMAFGFDQDEWVRCGATSRPFMLAWPGGCPRPHLHDLATDESFRGTLIVGVAPGLFFCHPEFPYPMRVEGQVRLARNWGPADEMEQRCRFLIEPRFCVLLKGATSLLSEFRYRIDLPQREGQFPAMRPRKFGHCDEYGRLRMFEGFENRPQDILAIEEFMKSFRPQLKLYPTPVATSILNDVVEDVAAVRRRGGNVIFVRYPSTGWMREQERANQPREDYWDRLVEETGCLGIHFEDHDELKDFDCPECSHLTQADAIEFTRLLHATIHRDS